MRDLESKNPPDRPLMSAETGNVEISRQDPLERALFPSDDVSVVREDWMVVCAVICEPVSLLFGEYQGDFRKKQRSGGRKYRKRLQHGHFLNIVPIRYQGGTGSAQLPNTERALANREAGK